MAAGAQGAGERAPALDVIAVVRGASRAFTVLVVGGLLLPIVAHLVPVLGSIWLSIVAVVAFVVAGYRTGEARVPIAQASASALCGYLLVLPLVLMNPVTRDVRQIGLTALAALVVGAATGLVAGRLRGGRPGSPKHRPS
ncbi:hypothetical protein HFP15_33265 [Amycolatopsis sp. K13G38]|uniref:Uncharacterized protein n=1 Tax=Amycolatopsis acididurans TaxID=2724524 RepID=A0ABX1JDK9_9PSEU|nr:hypothetical protein [Amycolatopsis acididurans]NKQ57743.1 hypothetical protein [Amycolatopsis acididurans]